jgi:NADH-quinone oxidoreductase subunit G
MTVATIYIDNRAYEFREEGQNLLQLCLSLGFDLPYFCWHPAMHSAGACRLCAVKLFRDAGDTVGRIVMSCMEGVRDGMRISMPTPKRSRSARA